ncbi:MAG: hypothetical protein HYX28_07430 [Candidatus Koribacter versatilis]|uniref:DUF1570 domain-containing protein n=1 Tax=Candidatus Korobacter versatilis TaxID=658062 RepID=A0A932EQ95_9BACT|nr:hypothetical protein [Candidatus Koribacter versatilis]
MRNVLAVVLLLATTAVAQTPHVVEVFHEFDRIGAPPLWPGFEPTKTAVEVFDGTNTYLYHHPKPPEGFTPLAGAPGVVVFAGQHDSVRANTGTELNAVPTATADLSKSKATVREQAALLIHETFHVYEKQAHPKWAANEAELFTYPFEDAELLAVRRVETTELLAALNTKSDPQAMCAAIWPLDVRKQRFAKMTADAVAYERGIELNEGLAQYLEYKSIGRPYALTNADFPVEQIRQRAYATGQALAILLDRSGRDWKEAMDGKPLDVLLDESIKEDCGSLFLEHDSPDVRQAEEDVRRLVASRQQRKRDFLSAPGWRIEIVAGKEPLWPQGFDPWNVSNLGDNNILHTRWAKMGNGAGVMEALDHASLTEGVGPHPLFNGAKRFIITGLAAPPTIHEKDGKLTIAAPGAKGSFTGASVTTTGTTVVLRLP